jgi:hypothetical protein
MTNFCKINSDNIIQQVIVADQAFIDSGAVGSASNWVQGTSGIGYTYDKVNNVFIAPQPYSSWSLDDSFVWQPPVAVPDGGNAKGGKSYRWDEVGRRWTLNPIQRT